MDNEYLLTEISQPVSLQGEALQPQRFAVRLTVFSNVCLLYTAAWGRLSECLKDSVWRLEPKDCEIVFCFIAFVIW